MNKSELFWQTYLNLEKETLEVSKYIFFTDEIIVNEKGKEAKKSCETQLTTFSPYIADLLIRCCVQIEAISKELYFNIGGTKQRGDKDLFFDEDCLKLIDQKWETHKKEVLVVSPLFNFTKPENQVLRPLREAHKRGGQKWEKSYQAVKHDRYSNLDKGNVKALLHALAALYLLNIYYRNDSWTIQYTDIKKIDYGLGSSIFAVKPPKSENLWCNNKIVISESPFVVKYREEYFKQIQELQEKENEELYKYWNNQPELQDVVFQEQLEKALDCEEDEQSRVIHRFEELCKYRLYLKIPESLGFEEKKERLIKSNEWNCSFNQRHIKTNRLAITPNNIKELIDSTGVHMAYELIHRYQKLEWLSIAMNKATCNVYIP